MYGAIPVIENGTWFVDAMRSLGNSTLMEDMPVVLLDNDWTATDIIELRRSYDLWESDDIDAGVRWNISHMLSRVPVWWELLKQVSSISVNNWINELWFSNVTRRL
jgi:hypothetical protein